MADDKWTPTQVSRFKELGIDPDIIHAEFSTPEERNKTFQKIEKKQVKDQREKLADLLTQTKKTQIQFLRERLEQTLYQLGFTGVSTPTITTKQALKKMTIDEDHPLTKQVFWLNDKQCLRPMLAPNLYSLMMDFGRLNQGPIRFFEIGACFRKESSGARHTNEFTMLNLVEMGIPEQDREERLNFLAKQIMKAAQIDDYHFETEDSKVYGSTLDVVAGPRHIEVASGAMGPHPLDAAWGITDTWVGIGFGLERLLMTSKGEMSIGKWAKNLAYVDGICLSI
ncbi:MAG: pyrrolysine--tRNA(Pyl) ligase large subunit [Deltaproteobacteria bacterium]|nr:MAG: pyrrolysine--tRNA(Pyl) ligase large subunit [Deltaproteobacteria bacterium]